MNLKPGTTVRCGKSYLHGSTKLLGTAMIPTIELKQGGNVMEVTGINAAKQATAISYSRGYSVGVVDTLLFVGTVWAGCKLYKALTREDKKD